jgi:NADP-dependent 3-hydroxy acid dehydrogenase YdfG
MKSITLITGASSDFCALAARALADAGHSVYASMQETLGRNSPQEDEVQRYAEQHQADLRYVELDVASSESVECGVAKTIENCGLLDVIIHNAGHHVLRSRRSLYARAARPAL